MCVCILFSRCSSYCTDRNNTRGVNAAGAETAGRRAALAALLDNEQLPTGRIARSGSVARPVSAAPSGIGARSVAPSGIGAVGRGPHPSGIEARGAAPSGIGARGVAPSGIGAIGRAPSGIEARGAAPSGIGARGVAPSGIGAIGRAPSGIAGRAGLTRPSSAQPCRERSGGRPSATAVSRVNPLTATDYVLSGFVVSG